MKIIEKERWSWALKTDEEKYVLSVLMGSVGIYEKEYVLEEFQVKEYLALGRPYIESLVSEYRASS
ncbi:MAG: hypothetical protein K6L73_15020 [Cellvibrionaceae bacterium]